MYESVVMSLNDVVSSVNAVNLSHEKVLHFDKTTIIGAWMVIKVYYEQIEVSRKLVLIGS